MGPHFMLLLSIYVLYSNVTYIYPVSCLVEIKLFQIVSNCFKSISLLNTGNMQMKLRLKALSQCGGIFCVADYLVMALANNARPG